jgi:hypothetical protein
VLHPRGKELLIYYSHKHVNCSPETRQVLHPRCITPAAMFGIPIEIRNTMDPSSEFTLITVDDYCKTVEHGGAMPGQRTSGKFGSFRAGSPSQTSPRQVMKMLPEPRTPKDETRNPAPETRSPKPDTRNPKPPQTSPRQGMRVLLPRVAARHDV